ncbi:MAG: hypothetical protein R6V03_10375 [Kiritimatiellia bacterium]
MITGQWSFAVYWGNVVAATVFFPAGLWLFARTLRSRSPSKAFVLNEMLRLLIIALLVFTLFRPEFIKRVEETRLPLVVVLEDSSASMQTEDVTGAGAAALSRREWLDARIEERFWEPLLERYRVVVERFSEPSSPETDPLSTGTDINRALREAAESYNDLRAVILLSDGDWTSGRSPVTAASDLRAKRVPVFAVVVGSDRYLPDLEIESVRAPAYGLTDESVSIPFVIQSRLPHDVDTSVSLLGPAGSETVKRVRVPAMSRFQDFVLLKPGREGDFRYSLRLPVHRDEVFENNNVKEFSISLRREMLKVLLAESVPRWEYRFLHNALSRDPGVDVKCFLTHAGMEPGEGKNYISSFPDSRDRLSPYDVVFLGDIGIGGDMLTEKQAVLLKGLVEQQGSGLVFLPGRGGHQLSLQTSPLSGLLPVKLDPAKPEGYGFRIESRAALTTRGREHILTMLAGSPAVNEALWNGLPGFYWYAPAIKARPGSEVLAVHSTARNRHGRIPILVTKICGNGKTLFMGTDSAWRWRRGVEDTYHYRFWSQVVRWMAHQRHLAHDKGIRFFHSPETPGIGNRVFLHATVLDESGYPLKEGTVKASIAPEEGTGEIIEMNAEPGGWGVFTGSFTPVRPGACTVTVTCPEAQRKVSSEIRVRRESIEKIGRPARSDVMREIASLTRGGYGGTGNLSEIVEKIKLLPEPEYLEERVRLWCNPLWAGLIIALLSAYWVTRKLIGLL